VPWTQDLIVTAETSDTVKVVDAITTLPSESLELSETWNGERLNLLDYQVEPGGSIVSQEGSTLKWELPEGGQVYTLTKWFHIEPCTWQDTTLVEELSTNQQLVERRAVPIQKLAPELGIDSSYDPTVLPGDVATFTLSYSNTGGYENDVSVRSDFPSTAPFAWSIPPADETGATGVWALWNVGDLAKDDKGEIIVAVAVQETAAPSTTIDIPSRIYDHTGEPLDSATTTFHVSSPPQATWRKLVNGDEWDPQRVIPAETDGILEVIDVVESPEPFNLTELWNPELLKLLTYSATGGQINTGPGVLDWDVTTQPTGPMTLTKRLEVRGGPWTRTIIEEVLEIRGVPEPLIRAIPVQHLLPPIDFPGGDWPWYAQEEITVWPEIPVAGQPTRICAEVINRDPSDAHSVDLELAVANLGIGLPFTPVGHTGLTVPLMASATATFL